MLSSLRLVPLLVLLVGCQDKTAAPGAAGSASAATEPTEAAPVPPAPPAPKSYPSDLNAAEVTRKLDCKSGKFESACTVWEEFQKATTDRFTGKAPSGESRWFGKIYQVDNGKETTSFAVLVCRPVPTMRVGQSSLPFMISVAPLPPELTQESVKLWRRMSGSRHRGNQKNQSFKYLEAYQPKDEQGVINTTGSSVQLITAPTEDVGYLRQVGLKRLLLVRPSRGLHAAPGDGLYAEFWQAIW
jgi:hypothetical protein